MIASWFVDDLTLPRRNALAIHEITAIGSSSIEKAHQFAQKHLVGKGHNPACYGSYAGVYESKDVDIVYIATPHAFHKQNCLDAIAAGKHTLCEKPMALNATEATEMIAAARQKGLFLMEGLWTRFLPIVKTLQKLLHEERVIGSVQRVFCDFGLDMPLTNLPTSSRLKDPALGAGSLLDIGIYSITWGLLCLEAPGKNGGEKIMPEILSAQTLSDGIDVTSSIVLFYPSGQHGILTSTTLHKTDDMFCRIEGNGGVILISGATASMPSTLTVIRKGEDAGNDMGDGKVKHPSQPSAPKKEVFNFVEESGQKGFCYEADAVALDIANGKTQSEIMHLNESLRVLEIMDKVRKQGGSFLRDTV